MADPRLPEPIDVTPHRPGDPPSVLAQAAPDDPTVAFVRALARWKARVDHDERNALAVAAHRRAKVDGAIGPDGRPIYTF